MYLAMQQTPPEIPDYLWLVLILPLLSVVISLVFGYIQTKQTREAIQTAKEANHIAQDSFISAVETADGQAKTALSATITKLEEKISTLVETTTAIKAREKECVAHKMDVQRSILEAEKIKELYKINLETVREQFVSMNQLLKQEHDLRVQAEQRFDRQISALTDSTTQSIVDVHRRLDNVITNKNGN
jgi:hypothetical protein